MYLHDDQSDDPQTMYELSDTTNDLPRYKTRCMRHELLLAKIKDVNIYYIIMDKLLDLESKRKWQRRCLRVNAAQPEDLRMTGKES